MKIAIIDCFNQDIGLKILFPSAHYYINKNETSTTNYRLNSCKYYNINTELDWDKINDSSYDYLFIIFAIHDAIQNIEHEKFKDIKEFIQYNFNTYKHITEIINNNKFKKVFIFDNYDYDYDPSQYFINNKVDLFFKRNYNKTKIYNTKVVPFPFIMFGETSLIEKCDREIVTKEEYFKKKIDRVFFTGGLYKHEDHINNVIRDRITIYNEIKHTIYNPGILRYETFLNELRNSKFSLDILGVGEPNKRTIEILLSGSLILSQKHDMKWPFDEDFCEETMFSDNIDYFVKLNNLIENDELYRKCLENQYNIVNKYFNKEWIKNYILSKI